MKKLIILSFILGTGFSEAKASFKLNCSLDKGEAIQITIDEQGATARFQGRTFAGLYKITDEPENTRLSGYKKLDVNANFPLLDHTKPYAIAASLVLSPTFESAFGWIEITGVRGTAFLSSGADCKMTTRVQNTSSPYDPCDKPNCSRRLCSKCGPIG